MGKWIDINVIPPPICDTFIVRLEPDGSIPNLLPEVDVASIDIDGDWLTFSDWPDCYKPTHWMPLPYPDLE
jgi:hypothetical protein